jgi:CRISPR-associated protein Csm3
MGIKKICLEIETQSNLFIGGTPTTFQIGGIDLFTITDYNGMPYIPASSLKGKVRSMVKELIELDDKIKNEAIKIKESYKKYLENLLKSNQEKTSFLKLDEKQKEQQKEQMEKRFAAIIDEASAEYLFGIREFNHAPKLMFNDMLLDSSYEKEKVFSTDFKNSISCKDDGTLEANPRTYQTVCPHVKFNGDIIFYDMDKLDIEFEVVKSFLESVLFQFNTGIYRLGNSGSRGYGRINIIIDGKGEKDDTEKNI